MTGELESREEGAPVRGLVLAGGGARGAYEAGVLSYIFEELPEELLARAPIRIFSGTSVGAIHACYLAATAHLTRRNIGRIVDLWRSLRIEDMLRLGPLAMLQLPREMRALFKQDKGAQGLVINSKLLQEVVVRNVPWPHIRSNLQSGNVDALTVTATHIISGRSTVFVDRVGGGVPPWTRDPRVVAKPCKIGAEHALASAAIPLLFPPNLIDGAYYADGGVRQNTPLSPALRLGANRVLVIGVRNQERYYQSPVEADGTTELYPSATFMLGKLVDALMLDRLDYDLARLEGFNTLLEDGKRSFGPSFYHQISETGRKIRGAGYRHVDCMVIRPSRNIGQMANEFSDVFREKLGRMAGWAFSQIASQDAFGDSDLLSYLLFDGRLAAALIEMGRADADAERERLIEYFSD